MALVMTSIQMCTSESKSVTCGVRGVATFLHGIM